MTEQFTVVTLDAAKILEQLTDDHIAQGVDGNFHINFRLDLRGKNSDVVARRETFAENALFRQIRLTLPTDADAREEFTRSLVFVDFKQVFRKNFAATDKTTFTRQELLRDTDAQLTEIFARGIQLSFDGGTFKKFTAFDKSNSMARQCVISFVAESLKPALDERLMLGMDFSEVAVVLSKFYSYRGLYLSDARRINSFGEVDNAVELNEQTVVVLPDCHTEIFAEIFTAEKKESCWECGAREDFLHVNCFDGEGLICPTWAARINQQLNIKGATSFQIRLPFTKGVLHAVDFKKFFADEFNVAGGEPVVEDIFGLRRNLLDAKIILTESMFKCGNWIRRWKERPRDPMKFFFAQMNHFDHALWICNTDANLHNSGKVTLNYQFLATLDLSTEEFNSLAAECAEQIRTVPLSLQNIFAAARRRDVDEDSIDLPTRRDSVREKSLQLLEQNDAFLRDPKVKLLVDSLQRDLEKNLCTGKFGVLGEVRFLSCDLLDLLIRIAERCNLDAVKIRELKAQTLRSENFFMAARRLTLKRDKYYAFLRSPHLSRNEQCILRPVTQRGGLYEKYFSQLTGAVMVSCKSTVPAILGGADFDGDLVKVIADKRIVDAVKRGAYVDRGKFFARKLPVVAIPSTKAAAEIIPPTIPFRVVKNTFAGQVGSVSNLALKLAAEEYFAGNENFAGTCAECTIVVGLEIDAAKTGVHPDENIRRLKSLARGKNLFLAVKDFWDDDGWFTPCVVKGDGEFKLYRTRRDLERGKVALASSSDEKNLSTLELLPLRYLQFLHDNSSALKSALAPSSKFFFAFECDDDWKKSRADATKLDDVRQLVQAFTATRRLARKVNLSRNFWQEKNFDSFIKILLAVQYDAPNQIVLEQVYATAAACLPTIDAVERALKILRERQWHFTPADNRRQLLAEILDCDAEELLPAAVQLLATFRDNGFMLLFHLLSDLKAALKISADIDDFIGDSEKLRALTLSDNKFWAELYGEYCAIVALKLTAADRDERLAAVCRTRLNEIFGGNFDDALKYFWLVRSEDPSRDFLWRVFTSDELLRNVYSEGGVAHA